MSDDDKFKLSIVRTLTHLAELKTPEARSLSAIVSAALLAREGLPGLPGRKVMASIVGALIAAGTPSAPVIGPSDKELPAMVSLGRAIDLLDKIPGLPSRACCLILKWAQMLYFARRLRELTAVADVSSRAVLPVMLALLQARTVVVEAS